MADIENRIRELEHAAEEDFGEFTRRDWIICIVGSLLLPYLIYVWFWP